MAKSFINEFVLLFTAIKDGFVFLFVGLPSKFFGGKKNKPVINENIKDAVTSGTYAENLSASQEKDLIGIVSEWLEKTYNNLPWVKSAREKMEASLKPIVLDINGDDAVRSKEKQVYKYLARNKEGKVITGFFPAFSKIDVYSYLTDEKMIVYDIKTDKGIDFLHGSSSLFQTKMANKDLIFWLAQLSTYIKAGIPLTDGVRVLAQQDKGKKYR